MQNASAALIAKESPELWHRRFGHLGYDNLARLAAGSMAQGMITTAAELSRLQGRRHVTPASLPNSTSSQAHLLHLTLTSPWSYSTQTFVDHCKFHHWVETSTLTFLDDCSKLAVVKPVKRKSDVPMVTKETILMLEKQSGHSLIKLRSDNGSNGVSQLNKELGEFLSDKRVLHQITTRYTPEQNGAAERLKRTIMEKVRAMLEDSGLPKELWAKAAVTACYIKNRSPETGRDKTP